MTVLRLKTDLLKGRIALSLKPIRLARWPTCRDIVIGQASRLEGKPMKFEGTTSYVATDDLKLAVNAAITLQRPLLIKGEPGTGKTMLAEEVAAGIGLPLLQWHIKSTTKAQQGLYEYDAVSRLRDSQLGDERVGDIAN